MHVIKQVRYGSQVKVIFSTTLFVFALALVLQLDGRSGPKVPDARVTMDFSQAHLMLRLLKSISAGRASPEAVDAVLNAKGTDLIVEQQNISRRVSKEQYKQVLVAANKDTPPVIQPVAADPRSERGVQGLVKDVWPSLRWGVANIKPLEERLNSLLDLDVETRARQLALESLPETPSFTPHLYVVMGGRAGAAALGGANIYFDVLATSYYASLGVTRYPGAQETVEFFAHEIHHVGLSNLLEQRRKALTLNAGQKQALDLLTALVMEGSATYLINAHRDLEAMRQDPQYSKNLSKVDELLKLSQAILESATEGKLSEEAYDKATEPFLGNGWHSAGAFLFAAIYRAAGIKGIIAVLQDPRQLLAAYNTAVERQPQSTWRFKPELAALLSRMGG